MSPDLTILVHDFGLVEHLSETMNVYFLVWLFFLQLCPFSFSSPISIYSFNISSDEVAQEFVALNSSSGRFKRRDGHYDARIIKGRRVSSANQYPFMASLQMNGNHMCGCSLLNDDSVLTAAHCVHGLNRVDNLQVYIGHVSLTRASSNSIFKVKSFKIHPAYKHENAKSGNDVAVIKLTSKVDFTDKAVGKTCLPSGPEDKADGSKCFAIGFGATQQKPGARPSSTLQIAPLPLLEHSECVKAIGGLPPSVICAAKSVQGGTESVCFGDSGGPFLCPVAGSGKMLQYGISSFVVSKLCEAGPSFFTYTAAFIPWIKEQAEN